MTVLGLTGSRSLKGQAPRVAERLEYLRSFDEYVTGACIGFDSLAGYFFATRYPNARHTVIVPADRSRVARWWLAPEVVGRVNVIEMPLGTSYRDRNVEIVRRSNMLWYCAEWPEDDERSRRSGTWQTVRLAAAGYVPVEGMVINQT